MSKRTTFIPGQALPAWWVNSIQEFVGTGFVNFLLEKASATAVRVPASSGVGQVGLGFGATWRYNIVTVTAAHPGGAAGTYNVWATATADNLSGTPPNIDITDYAFAIVVLASASTPSATHYRQIGTVEWDGSAITSVNPTSGVVGGGLALVPDTAARNVVTGTATIPVIGAQRAGDTVARMALYDGKIEFGPGSSARSMLLTANVGSDRWDFNENVNAPAYLVGGTLLASTHLSDSAALARLAGPALSGVPTAPTAAVDTNTTQLATTAFVVGQGYAKLASPVFTGTPAAPDFIAQDVAASLPTLQLWATDAGVDSKRWYMGAGATSFSLGTLTDAGAIGAAALTITRSGTAITTVALAGTPTGPTAAVDTSTTQLATTAYVVGQGYAKLVSPALTGVPTAPTAAVDTSTTQIATTAYVVGQGYAKLASPALTGVPTAPTASIGTNTTQIATTAFVLANGPSDVPTKLYQGTPTTGAATIYTVPGTKQTRFEMARVYNADTVARTVTLYEGGTAAGNTILPDTEIPAGEWIEVELSGVVLTTGSTIAAKASANSVVVLTLYGSEEAIAGKVYKRLAQVTVGTGATSLFTSTARTRITHIRAANIGAAARGFGMWDGGTATGNVIQSRDAPSSQVPAGGVMEIQSYLGGASGTTYYGAASAAAEVVVSAYGIEG